MLLLDDLAGALKLLQDHLLNGTAHYNTVAGMLAHLNDANKARLRGTASNEDLQRAYNGIPAAISGASKNGKAEKSDG